VIRSVFAKAGLAHEEQNERHTAQKYSNAIDRERLRQHPTGQ